jgi:hypothetical protein
VVEEAVPVVEEAVPVVEEAVPVVEEAVPVAAEVAPDTQAEGAEASPEQFGRIEDAGSPNQNPDEGAGQVGSPEDRDRS